MPRRCSCTIRTGCKNLKVLHRLRSGGKSLRNAEVLCTICFKSAVDQRKPLIPGQKEPPEFPEKKKVKAIEKAGDRCECTRDACKDHH